MSRRPLLDQELTHILTTRIEISRVLNIFTLEALCGNWTISKATMYRYGQPRYRESTRSYQRQVYEERRATNLIMHGKCWKCQNALLTHQRCEDCSILLHGQSMCRSCIDTRRRKIIRESETINVSDLFNL